MAAEKTEMRTCKTCGETKPLEEGFKAIQRKGVKIYYYNSCKTCRNKEIRRKRAEKRAAEEAADALAAAIRVQEEARAVINLFESIKAAREACPILSFSLWTGDTPQRLGAW